IEQAQELMEAAGRRSKGILLGILVLVAIVFAGLYLVHLVSLSRQAPRNFIIVKAKEDKAVDLGVNCKQASVDCSEKVKRQLHGRQLGTVAPYRGLLSETLTKLYASNPNVPKRTIMVLKGDTEGEGWIALKDGNGAALLGKDGKPLRRRLICRGVVPRAFPESIAGAEAQQQAREQAMMLEAEGDVLLQDGRHYDAWQKFRLANDLYLAARVKDRSTSCNAKVIAARTQLAKQLQGTFVDAISMAFPVEARTGGPNFTQANILLDSAKTMIPDLNSVDRQVIEIWQVIVERAKEKHKAEKG
ncbi:MAG: hypothetical protein J6333_09885, partial [Planctomycetes bacterium]|nr:hypothetical protein [Planctomycetota bacterium]